MLVICFDVLQHYRLDVGGGCPTVAWLDLVSTVVISILQNLWHIVFAPLSCCIVELRAVVVVPHYSSSVRRYFRYILLSKTRLRTTLIKPIILVHTKAR